jgi:hypothetical protein
MQCNRRQGRIIWRAEVTNLEPEPSRDSTRRAKPRARPWARRATDGDGASGCSSEPWSSCGMALDGTDARNSRVPCTEWRARLSRQQRQKQIQSSAVQHSAAQLPVEHSTAHHSTVLVSASHRSVRKVRLVRALVLVRSPRTAGGRALVGIVATVSVSVVKMQMRMREDRGKRMMATSWRGWQKRKKPCRCIHADPKLACLLN